MLPSADGPRLTQGALHVLVRSPAVIRREIREALAERRVIPAHLFYETSGGAANWTALTEDPSYASANDSSALFARHGEEIGGVVAQACGTRAVRAVSLGPGNGAKDEGVLAWILRAAARPPASRLRYYGLDTSSILAGQAMVRMLVSDELSAREVAAAGLVARFEDLPLLRALYEAPEAVTLVMLLGNTLGNLADESALLRLVAAGGMRPGDLLLLEVTLRKPGTDEVASLGDPLTIRKFNFEPLAALGLELALENMTYRTSTDRSAIPGTLTVVANYRDFAVDGEETGSADLAYVHRYREEAIPAALAGAGFTVWHPPWFGPDRRSMLLLARRTG